MATIPPADLGTVTITVKRPKPTPVIENPLHQYASWSYCWSLWWLDTTDFNLLMSQPNIDAAMAWEPSTTSSWVIAEDSGLYPDRRFPSTLPLNYNIQSVEFETTAGPTNQTRSSNLIDGTIKIVEPYGITLLDQLVAMSYNTNTSSFQNYTQQPFMLQCDFKGWDDNGNPIPASQLSIYRKRFPIRLLSLDIDAGKGGAEYTISYVSAGGVAHHPETATTPIQLTITAGTVEEFLNGGTVGSNGHTTVPGMGLAYQLNKFYLDQVPTAAQLADQYRFVIDPTIAASSIINAQQISLPNLPSGAGAIKSDKQTFTIPAKTSIVDIITRVMAHSDYFSKLQKINAASATQAGKANAGTEILNTFRTTTSIKYSGADKSGQHDGQYDVVRQHMPTLTTFNILQYSNFKSPHPATNSTLVDPRPYAAKQYSYLYTGENIDIIDFKLSFQTTYFTSVLAYQSAVAATQVSKATGTDVTNNAKPAVTMNPAIIFNVPNATPYRSKADKVDKSTLAGGNIESNPDAIVVADVLKSLYSKMNGDMITIDLSIVGDPTLIRQDDWLYVPNPSNAADTYNDTEMNQADFANRYGHVRFDTSELVVNVTVNNPVDIDDGGPGNYNNTGLMYPQMDGTNTYKALFSGQYTIITIKNKFSNGKFEQELSLARIMQSNLLDSLTQQVVRLEPDAANEYASSVASDLSAAYGYTNNGSSAVSNSQDNQRITNNPNGGNQ